MTLTFDKYEPDESEIAYQEKTADLKNYLRKKIIHASIFKQSGSNFDKEVAVTQTSRGQKDPLAEGLITCDFKGAPIKI